MLHAKHKVILHYIEQINPDECT